MNAAALHQERHAEGTQPEQLEFSKTESLPAELIDFLSRVLAEALVADFRREDGQVRTGNQP